MKANRREGNGRGKQRSNGNDRLRAARRWRVGCGRADRTSSTPISRALPAARSVRAAAAQPVRECLHDKARARSDKHATERAEMDALLINLISHSRFFVLCCKAHLRPFHCGSCGNSIIHSTRRQRCTIPLTSPGQRKLAYCIRVGRRQPSLQPRCEVRASFRAKPFRPSLRNTLLEPATSLGPR